ncbi:MAG: nucleotidyl transferase AbiEii/AbiGii toxin family protein, partial [Endomicrobium sp.]|nr:nucleotidyl transferase AbiEii/AbiGii toxin family protein [Endomicrobium sp.]
MIHENKIEFKNLIWRIAKITNFTASLIEKDYYLSIILLEINKLSQDLIFKGGTCLNKIYFPYHRISEDLDFNLLFRLPTKAEKKITGFSPRRESLKHIENNINSFMKQFGLMPTRELKK